MSKILGSTWGFDSFKEYFDSRGHITEPFSFKHHLEDHGSLEGSKKITDELINANADVALIERGSSARRIFIHPKSIRKMKRNGVRPVLLHWDIPLVKNIGQLTPEALIKFYGKGVLYYDTVFITFPQGVEMLRNMGANAHLLYKGVDHLFQKDIFDINITNKTYDITLCGTSYGKCRYAKGFARSEIAKRIIDKSQEENWKFALFGKGWVAGPNDPFSGDKYYSNMRALVAKDKMFESHFEGKEKQSKICRIFAHSKINIGTLLVNYEEYWGARPFEVLGANSFLLLGNLHPSSKLLKDGEHFVRFDSQDDMIEKIKYYLEHEDERNKIVRSGYDFIMKNHTAMHRAQAIEKILSI